MSSPSTATKNGKGAAGAADGDGEAPEKKKGKLKLVLLALVVVLVGAGAAWWFFLRTPAAEAAPKEEEVELGEVLTVEPISINLADGHYLKLGLGLQQVLEVEHAVSGSQALDAAIALYSGREMSELQDPARRDELKAELKHELEERYHHDVVDVYFTQYVMQ